jgi:hypothetical protein
MLHPRTTAPAGISPGSRLAGGGLEPGREVYGEHMSYTELHMRRFFLSVTVMVAVVTLVALAGENLYQPATVLSIEKKATTRVLYYMVNTPITSDDPYYEVSLRLKDIAYTARYTPRHKADELPDEWKAGASVQARLQGRHLFVKTPAGGEVQLVVTKRKALPVERNDEPTPANK